MKLPSTTIVFLALFFPANPATAMSQSDYSYGYWWGGLNAVCGLYKLGYLSDKEARLGLSVMVDGGKEGIEDTKLKNKFIVLLRTDEGLKKQGCAKLIND